MINYIIGFGVAALVLFIIIRGIIRKKRGESSGCGCGSSASSWNSCSSCSSCSSSSCCSSHENGGEN